MESSFNPPKHRWPGIRFDWKAETRLAVAVLIRHLLRYRTLIAVHRQTWDLAGRPAAGICAGADIRSNNYYFYIFLPGERHRFSTVIWRMLTPPGSWRHRGND
jgi:hypothetical protein